MKLSKLIFCAFFCLLLSPSAVRAVDPGLRVVNTRGFVRCGTSISAKTYAYQDKEKNWQGIDADLCRLFAIAIFGDAKKFELVNVSAPEISMALATNSIDIMLGNNALSANAEIKGRATAIDVLYYDKQMFLAKKKRNATSMEAYRDSSVCVVKNSANMSYVDTYNRKYNLGFKLLPFNTLEQAKAAFLLNRCQILSANELYLKGIAESVISSGNNFEILPEIIVTQPVYAYTARENPTLRIIAKWILNAPVLAEANGITSKNIDTFIGQTDNSVRNLLGIDKPLWEAYGLNSQWAKQALKEIGNFGEIYERNLGEDSSFKIPRDKNNLVENGGLMIAKPFL